MSLHRAAQRASAGVRRKHGAASLRALLSGAGAFAEGGAEAAAPLRWATAPYAAPPAQPPPPPEPEQSTVLLFPGQGAQFVGMGRRLADVPAARELYQLASDVVGWDVWRVCTEGPADELARRCQTCVLVTALAATERAQEQRPAALQRARAAAGFSLGELAALVWAGALQLEPALRLVELRSAAMEAAAQARAQGMLTLWLAPDARLNEALRKAREHAAEQGVPQPVASVANYLYPGCKVVAGDELALRWLEREGAALGVRRAARVGVSGAFHSALMAPAELPLRAALRSLAERGELRAPRLRVVSAVDARAYGGPEHVRRQLARHVTRPVRWEQTLHALYARPRDVGFPLTLALGPGGALRSTLRQVNARAWDSSLQIEV